MSRAGRREAAVRELLDGPMPTVPPDLCTDAVRRGTRILRRRTALRRLLWLLLLAAVVAFAVWASITEPWVRPPSETTPVSGW